MATPDIRLTNACPGVEYNATETGATYYETREVNGALVIAQNATFTTTGPNANTWSLVNSNQVAHAISVSANGSLGFLCVAAHTSTPWTVWGGNGNNGVYNVRDFGALGNGSTNDAPAINNAITACNAAGGGQVYLSPGTYLVSGSVNLQSGVRLKGQVGCFGITPTATPYGTVIKGAGGAYDVISNSGVIGYCGVEDVTISGVTNGKWAIHAIQVTAGLLIRNVGIQLNNSYTTAGGGIWLDPESAGIFGAAIENVSVYNATHLPFGGTGIQIGGTPGEVNACTLSRIEVQALNVGVTVHAAGGNTLTGLWAENCTTGAGINSDCNLVLGGWFESDSVDMPGQSYPMLDIELGVSSTYSTVVGTRHTASYEQTSISVNGTNPSRVLMANTINPFGYIGSPPAVPTSTRAATNTVGTDATVYVTAGAASITAISIGGKQLPIAHVTAGTTSPAIRVPAGQTIGLTYGSGAAPTWEWFGD